MKNYKIAVAGTGYVGLSLSVLLAQHNQVTAVDIVQAKVDMINNHRSPIQDDYIEKYLAEKELNLTATLDAKSAYSDADFVVIAAPTNYDSKTQHFDTSAVEAVIKLVMEYNPNAVMVIKSTIPVGYTASVREKFGSKNIIFSPEFLRESKALYDNLYAKKRKELDVVGILTFHRAVNYGAVLQTYALQGALNDLKIENEVLDYRCPFIEAHYNPKPSVSPIHVKHFFKEVTQIRKWDGTASADIKCWGTGLPLRVKLCMFLICLCQKFFMKDREKRTQSIRRIMLRQQNL